MALTRRGDSRKLRKSSVALALIAGVALGLLLAALQISGHSAAHTHAMHEESRLVEQGGTTLSDSLRDDRAAEVESLRAKLETARTQLDAAQEVGFGRRRGWGGCTPAHALARGRPSPFATAAEVAEPCLAPAELLGIAWPEVHTHGSRLAPDTSPAGGGAAAGRRLQRRRCGGGRGRRRRLPRRPAQAVDPQRRAGRRDGDAQAGGAAAEDCHQRGGHGGRVQPKLRLSGG